ncbi:prolyl oligopeptidase family serine peptidase [Sphingomonas echinoides]|uniref:prolyl oligopeptidase n=3 Tax=Pseudomonadota TaxID=1224 RepID=A0ABU4PL96_9SPHN|nr:prolyl oligopeptidase family serine peptidase [Sphingomonas echinoides]MDX5984204.1 prolyl oligopeptidase family serine peptidase [Sphingomonas echinoides]
MRLTLPLIALVLAAPAQLQAQTMHYPETRRVTQVDEQFGVKVADPYRWLENDVRTDAEVAKWVADENALTNAYLATLPGRDIFAARLKTLLDYERFGVPVKKGGHYFYTHNSGLQNQAVLYVRDSVDGAGRVLIDPNGWSKDGATALAEWSPSEDGKKLAYAVQDGGTDWRTVKVLDVATGAVSDTIEWVKFSGLAWAKDGSGFYYSRFAAPAAGAKFQALNENQQIYFHKLGTAQAADPLIYATPESPKLGHTAQVTDDGKWLVITTHEGTDNRYQITVIDLTAPKPVPRTIFKGLDYEWSLAGNVGGTFYWVTNKNAPRGRIVATNLYARSAEVPEQELVAQGKDVLDGASLVGGKLLVSYLADVKSEIRRYTLDGKPDGVVPLPGIGAAGGFGGEEGDPETFFAFTSFATPTTIYRYDVKTGQATPWAAPKVAFDPARYTVEQRFYASKDGTQVPMFIVRRKDVSGPAPTLLYAYGGFNISVTPAFSATRLAWLEQGGVLAVANIRGGGEYGKAWHDGGRLANKQNVFDDFIAAGEYLKAQGVTGKDQLVIQGGSNGGLLVGAVTNQRPDLFAAALPAVGVMDMLRFDRFTAGRYWVDDYGYPSKEADFKTLYAYSPYHNIRAGKAYPAILAETADTDDRVVPGHTFKYTAMLQSLDLGPKPRLVRIETRAGHGSGKPTDKVIAETADAWAFAAKWTGLTVKPVE